MKYLIAMLLLISIFSPVVFADAYTAQTYTFVSENNAYLSGTAVVNETFYFAGSRDVFVYENNTFKKVYSSVDKVILNFAYGDDGIYLVLATLQQRNDGTNYDENGGSGGWPGWSNGYDNSSGDSGGDEDNSSSGGGSTPNAPVLHASAGNGYVLLTWTIDNVDPPGTAQIEGYRIYRSNTPGHETLYATVSDPNTLSYNDTGVTNGKVYYYYVTAFTSSWESSPSNEEFARPKDGDGGPEPTAPPLESTVDVGFNVTNIMVLKMDRNFTVQSSYDIGLTIYASAQQLPHVARFMQSGSDTYLSITGERADNTLNYTTHVYKLGTSGFAEVFSSDFYAKDAQLDGTRMYFLIGSRVIAVFDTSQFALVESKNDITGGTDEYNAIYLDSKLHIAGSTMSASYATKGLYIIEEKDLSAADMIYSLNETSAIRALFVYNGTAALVDAASGLYIFKEDTHALQWGGKTDMSYVKDVDSNMYRDMRIGTYLYPLYVRMYGGEKYHFAWGGYYMHYEDGGNRMSMYITLTDRPVGWVELRTGIAGFLIEQTSQNWQWIAVAVVVLIGIAAYLERRRR